VKREREEWLELRRWSTDARTIETVVVVAGQTRLEIGELLAVVAAARDGRSATVGEWFPAGLVRLGKQQYQQR